MDTSLRKKSHEHLKFLQNLVKTGQDEKEILSKAYLYTKSISRDFYDGQKMHSIYNNNVKINLIILESKYKSRIIDVKSNLDGVKSSKKFDNFIDYIVYLARIRMCMGEIADFDDLNLTDKCHEAALYIDKKCKENNIKSSIIKIIPGYDKNVRIYGTNFLGYHFANIILYENAYYLLDTTFSQFFYTRFNLIDRIGLVNTPPCDPGYFMLISEIGKNMACELIEKGYVKLDKYRFKTYLDAFTLSYRNGLYYETTGDFSFETGYSLKDYEKLLNGEMSQVNIEGKENLGIQSRPLKDYQMIIKKR